MRSANVIHGTQLEVSPKFVIEGHLQVLNKCFLILYIIQYSGMAQVNKSQ